MSSNSDDTSPKPESPTESADAAVVEAAAQSEAPKADSPGAASEAAVPTAGDAESAEAGGSESATATEAADKGGKPTKRAEKDRFWYWVVGIALLLCIELFIYGRDGLIEVCVGVDGVTDFSAKGQPRTKENARKLPQCTVRLNLGMYNNSEELAKGALLDACGRATMTNRDELPNCMTREKKWTRRVTKTQVPPWDPRLYRRLLWLD